jgi:hypothetical protein
MMGLMDLIEFMTARLDEEESAAKAHEGELYADRAIATVAAHRRILERATSGEIDEGDMCALAAFDEAEHIVCLLAQLYANHPQYRAEWKP